MTVNSKQIPETWLAALGGHDISGWLSAFVESPKKAVADLLWDAFYFGPLNLTDRGQLLAGWLDQIGNSEKFAERLDAELTGWVEENWGRFDHSAELLASSWSCLCSIVVFSSKLPGESSLKNCAAALRARFAERQRFLGSFSTAPAADPLGLYLAVIAEFQVADRSLAAFWHNMCDMPDGVPLYHARYAILGLRRQKASDPSENGTLRAEVVFGLLRLARAFDRLVRERGLPEHTTKATFRRVAAQTSAAYPNSPRWREHGLSGTLELPERVRRWLLEAIPPLAEAVRREKNNKQQYPHHQRQPISPDPSWSQRSRSLAARLSMGNRECLTEVRQFLDEQRRYAEATGDTYNIVHTLCNFASKVLRFNPRLALRWAEEARKWEPYNDFTWNTVRTVLIVQGRLTEALQVAWVAWKRFPQDVVAYTGLAEALKAARRFFEAEAIYLQTIARFPENFVARNGFAELLKDVRRYGEAVAVYREVVKHNPEDVRARNGLADTLWRWGSLIDAENEYRSSIAYGYVNPATFVGLAVLVLRKGELGRTEALHLVDQALRLDPGNRFALQLKKELGLENEDNLDDLTQQWDEVADSLFKPPKVTATWMEELEGEDETRQLVDVEQSQDSAEQLPASDTEQLVDTDSVDIDSNNLSVRESETESLDEGEEPRSAAHQPVRAEVEIDKPHTGKIESRRFMPSDPLKVAALIAEAYFYRTWAKGSDGESAVIRRRKAASLVKLAERVSKQDPQVLAERAALEVDEGNELLVYQKLTIQLASQPAAIPLLVLKARLDRERAEKEGLRLNEVTLADLCTIPQRLRDLDSTLVPLFYFQKGLAAFALLDGALRKQTAIDSFSRFRRMLAYRAAAEKKERETSRDRHIREVPHFHEWLQRQAEMRIFGGLIQSEGSEIRADDISRLEETWEKHPEAFEEVEDIFGDRLAFRTI